MQQVGLIVLLVSILAAIVGFMQRMKAKRVADAPWVSTGDAGTRGAEVASPKGAISAQGQVRCDQPLIAPVSGRAALYYRVTTTAAWKEGGQTKTKEVDTQQAAAAFAINDGTGEVWVDARKGGDFEPKLTREESKSAGLIGGITGQELVFGQHRVSPGMFSVGTKFTVREEVLPVEARLYVCGNVGERTITSPAWRNLVISNRTREEVLSSATKHSKFLLAGGAGAFVLGTTLTVIGALVGGGDAKASATVATSATPSSTAHAAVTPTVDTTHLSALTTTTGADTPAAPNGRASSRTSAKTVSGSHK